MPIPEWNVCPTPEFIRAARTYEKKHPDELAAALANLQQRYLPRLNHARRHGLVQAGCLHHEGDGIIAIDRAAKAEVSAKPGSTRTRTTLPSPSTSS